MYQLKKSKKSKARFYTTTSTYFSYRKHQLFKFFIPKNPSRNNTGKVSMSCKRRKFKNLDLAINYPRLEMNHTCLVTRISFWKKKKPYVLLVRDRYNSLSYYIAPFFYFVGMTVRTLPTKHDFYKKEGWSIKIRSLGTFVMLMVLKVNDVIFNLLSPTRVLYKLALAAGTYFKILYRSFCKTFYVMTIPSGLIIKVPSEGLAVMGRSSNTQSNKRVVGLAGINFFNGVNPRVRGVAMNPVDHPNGGRTKTPKPERSP